MIANYQNLSEEAKVFLYPSSRKFYPNELEELDQKIKEFISSFEDISIAFKIEYQRFIIFFISEDVTISTSFMDKIANFIIQLETDYSITLLDKVNVCFKQGEHVQYQEMKRFRELIKKKSVSKKTIVFNNFLQSKYEFENQWEVVITDSWLSHLIK
ncbi:MAG: ABC transporter ATPase [Flavobacteriaceae bacterium]